MYYEQFEQMCRSRGVRPAAVSKATGISTATLSNWKKGNYTPKVGKLSKVAEYFEVTLEQFLSGDIQKKDSSAGCYENKTDDLALVSTALLYDKVTEVMEMAQSICRNPKLKRLYKAAGDCPDDLLDLAIQWIELAKQRKEGTVDEITKE